MSSSGNGNGNGSGPADLALDFVPSTQDVPRLSATTPQSPASSNATSADATTNSMRGLLPWPMSQFDSIPVYSLCYSSPLETSGGRQGQTIRPLPCPVMSHFAPTVSRSKSKSSLPSSVPNPPTTAAHASSLDICTSRACRDLAQFAHLNAQTLGKYPWLVDQGTRAAAAGGARDACALASCPHAYHAFTATVCVPLSHPELKKRGATLDRAPPGTRPDLAALLEASVKAPDRDVAPGLGVCLSAMPLGSWCNPDVVVINPPPSLDRPQPQQANGTLHLNRLPAALLPPAWSTDAEIFSASDLVSGALVDGQLFVSSLWPLPRTPDSVLPPQRPNQPVIHPIWSPIYSLTTCTANKTIQAQMPGEPCTSTAQCAMSPCIDPLNNYPITPGGNVTGQCSRRWMSKANVTVTEQDYVKALDAAQAWESKLMWITIGLMFPAFLIFTFASMCGTDRVWKWCRERRRKTRDARRQARAASSSQNRRDASERAADVESGGQQATRMSSLDRAHLEQLRLIQEIALYMRGIDPQSVRPKSGPPTSRAHLHQRSGGAGSSRPVSGTPVPVPTAPPPVVLAVTTTTPSQSTLGSLPRPHIPPRTNPPSAAAAGQGLLTPAPASATTTNAPHIPRPRFAAPAVTSSVPARPVIPPRLQNASIPVGGGAGGARPSGQSAAPKTS